MVITFNEKQLYAFKEKHPKTVILLADKSKNPGSVMGSWDKIKPQTQEEMIQFAEMMTFALGGKDKREKK